MNVMSVQPQPILFPGRVYLDAEEQHIDEEDPFAPVFKIIEQIQECAVPLITGVIIALVMANFYPDTYFYYFGSAHGSALDNVVSNHEISEGRLAVRVVWRANPRECSVLNATVNIFLVRTTLFPPTQELFNGTEAAPRRLAAGSTGNQTAGHHSGTYL